MIKKPLFWLYSAATYLLWTVVIIVAIGVLGFRYLVFPNIHDYKDRIAQEVGHAAGQKITIGDIKASWDGLNPHLDLYKVDLYDAQNRSALSLDHVETSLSWLSLMVGEARLSNITINQPKLTIRRDTDGTLYVAGISMNGPSKPEFPNWLLRQSSINVLNASIVWQDDLRHAPALALEKLNLRISSPAWESLIGRHRFGLTAIPSVGASQPIDIRGNFTGSDVSRPEDWDGTLYAKIEGLDIAVWKQWVDYPFDLNQGVGASQFWLDINNGAADSVTTDVLLSNVHTHFGKNSPEAILHQLSGRLSWRKFKNGQSFRAERLNLSTAEGLEIRNGKVLVSHEKNGATEQVTGDIRLDEIGLDQIATFAGYLPVSAEFKQALTDIAPSGKMRQLALIWSGTPENPERYSLSGNFSGLGMHAYRGVPGFSNLNGAINATQSEGSLSIDTRTAMIDLKNILRMPTPADRLTGQVKWTRKDHLLDVDINDLAITNAHLSGIINAGYRYNGSDAGDIDLTAKLDHLDGKFASYYYPTILGPDTMHWLDTSIRAGRAENVNVIVRGKLDDFPWDKDKRGLFQVKASLSDGVLDYAEGWPRAEGLRLNMLFQGNRMELNADQGRLYGNQITKAKAVIPNLAADHPVLDITGELQAPANEAIRYINNSPISQAIDHFTDGLHASGSGKLTLALHIPLDNSAAGSKVKGSYQLSNATLSGDADFPALEHIVGKLDFTESTVRAQNVSAQIFGGPAQFSLENGKDGALKVTAQGRINDTGIRQAIHLPLTEKLHGSADWNGEINVRKHHAEILVKSSLVGLSSSLPQPFDKGPLTALPLRIEKHLQGEKQDVLSLNLGNITSAKFLRTDQNGVAHIDRGEVNFGGTAELPTRSGISIKGSLDHVDLDQWQSLLGKGSSDNGDLEISGVNLTFGSLDAMGRRINELKLNAKPITDGWQAGLQSREIDGDVLWLKSGHGKVVARLKSLIVPSAAPAKMTADESAVKKDQEYPALDIVAESFEAKQKKLGKLELLANPQGDDWAIEKLVLSNPESTLTANGEWHNWKSRPNTRVNLNWSISDVGKTLERFGYPDAIKGGTAELKGQLKWPGSPHEFSVAELGGNLQLHAQHGQFLKVQPGVGRLFSVLSLQNLPRRLTLDFRDVFSSGFAFDDISTTVRIDKGVMRSDDFKMEGPAAKVAMSGETDLNHETQNLHIEVTPLISDSLALAALAGGPAVGAAAWVAQKLLKDPLNKLAAYDYDITGTWDNPQEGKTKSNDDQSTPAPTPLGKP